MCCRKDNLCGVDQKQPRDTDSARPRLSGWRSAGCRHCRCDAVCRGQLHSKSACSSPAPTTSSSCSEGPFIQFQIRYFLLISQLLCSFPPAAWRRHRRRHARGPPHPGRRHSSLVLLRLGRLRLPERLGEPQARSDVHRGCPRLLPAVHLFHSVDKHNALTLRVYLTALVPQSASPASAVISNSVLESNLATARAPRGGAVTAFFASLSLSNATVRNNSVVVNAPELGPFDLLPEIVPFGSGSGGGLFLYSVSVSVDRGSSISGNVASVGGGAFLGGKSSTLSIASSRVGANTATDATSGSGGGVYLDGAASFTASNATFDGNAAQVSGGGVFAAGVGTTVVSGLVASNNRAVSGTGGVLSADINCTSVTFANSNFSSNSAPAGAVAFFSGWLAAKGAAAQAPACTGTCSLRSNTADLWGGSAFAATDIAAASVALSRSRLSSGSAFSATFNLVDGFGVPVLGRLVGATITASCNVSSALTGTLVSSYNSNNTRFEDLKIIGAKGFYSLQFSVAATASQLLPAPIVGRIVVQVVDCSSTEYFDPQSETCLCVPNRCGLRKKAPPQAGTASAAPRHCLAFTSDHRA